MPRLSRRPAPVLAAFLALACGGDATPPTTPPVERASLVASGPAEVAGTLDATFAEPGLMRYVCAYDVRFVAGRERFPVGGASLTLQRRAGGDLPPVESEMFDAATVATWFGSPELGAGVGRRLQLRSWITFAPTANEYGRTGAHRASWAFAYGTTGDSARYAVECTPAMSALAATFADARTDRPIAGLATDVAGRALTTRLDGHVLLPDLVAGRYAVRVRDERYAALDTVIDTRPPDGPRLLLARIAPAVDGVWTWPIGTAPVGVVPPPPGGALRLHHPDGAVHLPERVRITLRDTSTVPAWTHETDAVATDADGDAASRRYEFQAETPSATHVVVALPWTGRADVVVECVRSPAGWSCRDR